MSAGSRACARRALGGLLLLWAGMLLGISFLAIPAQFGVASLSRPVAFEIVRQVMTLFTWTQLALAALALLAAALARPSWPGWTALALAGAMLLLQAAWLLPIMAERVELILAGQTPPLGPWHALYQASEVTKLLALLAGAWLARPGRRPV
jgi:hypothetical protein